MKINSLKMEEVNPSILINNGWNTNVVSPENEIKIEASIDRLGMFKPILVRTLPNGDFQILGGEHRVEAAIRKGIENVPIINLGNINDSKAKEISLVDNGRYGADDAIKLTDLLNSLDSEHVDLSSFLPFSDDEMESLFTTTSIALDDLELPDDDDEPVSLAVAPTIQTHQIMRFKIPVDDAEAVTDIIELIMKAQEFTESDSLTNAGDALVWISKQFEEKS